MGTSVLAGHCKKGSKGSLYLCLHGAAVCPAGRCISGMERDTPAVFCRAAQDQVGSCFPFQIVGAESLFKVLRGGRRISREEGFVKLGLPMRRDALLLSL